MKPNIKSPYFKLSLLFVVLFLVQSFIEGRIIMHAIKDNKSTNSVSLLYWLGLVWLSVAATFYYKTTRFKQSGTRLLIVFIAALIVFAPLAAIIYTVLVLLPSYSLVNNNGFSQ